MPTITPVWSVYLLLPPSVYKRLTVDETDNNGPRDPQLDKAEFNEPSATAWFSKFWVAWIEAVCWAWVKADPDPLHLSKEPRDN